MIWELDPADRAPLYEQLARRVRSAVESGELGRGDRLPSARTLSESLEVNMHTVLKAYQLLRDEGLVELRRGRGAVIAATPPRESQEALPELARRLVARARADGLDGAALDRLLAQVRKEATS